MKYLILVLAYFLFGVAQASTVYKCQDRQDQATLTIRSDTKKIALQFKNQKNNSPLKAKLLMSQDVRSRHSPDTLFQYSLARGAYLYELFVSKSALLQKADRLEINFIALEAELGDEAIYFFTCLKQ